MHSGGRHARAGHVTRVPAGAADVTRVPAGAAHVTRVQGGRNAARPGRNASTRVGRNAINVRAERQREQRHAERQREQRRAERQREQRRAERQREQRRAERQREQRRAERQREQRRAEASGQRSSRRVTRTRVTATGRPRTRAASGSPTARCGPRGRAADPPERGLGQDGVDQRAVAAGDQPVDPGLGEDPGRDRGGGVRELGGLLRPAAREPLLRPAPCGRPALHVTGVPTFEDDDLGAVDHGRRVAAAADDQHAHPARGGGVLGQRRDHLDRTAGRRRPRPERARRAGPTRRRGPTAGRPSGAAAISGSPCRTTKPSTQRTSRPGSEVEGSRRRRGQTSAQTLKPRARSCSRPSSVILSGPHGGIQTQLIRTPDDEAGRAPAAPGPR